MILGWKAAGFIYLFKAGREMRNLTGLKMQPPPSAFALALPEAGGHGGIHSQK